MKPGFRLPSLGLATCSLLLAGCLFRTASVPTRHFVLAAIPPNESGSAVNDNYSVEIGFVKMPAYLLRDSIAVRTGPNEIEFLENALWGERLDQCFPRTLMVDLSQSLSSEDSHLRDPELGKKVVKLFVTVHQFDVDTTGHGRLIAQWRIVDPDTNENIQSGTTTVSRTRTTSHADPEAIAGTMSDLTADFSHELAQSIRRSAKPGTSSR